MWRSVSSRFLPPLLLLGTMVVGESEMREGDGSTHTVPALLVS
jgi:hypothetical protein